MASGLPHAKLNIYVPLFTRAHEGDRSRHTWKKLAQEEEPWGGMCVGCGGWVNASGSLGDTGTIASMDAMRVSSRLAAAHKHASAIGTS